MSTLRFDGAASEQQCRTACLELGRLLRAGELACAEDILAAAPGLAQDPELALEVIYTEYVTMQELGRPAEPAAWYARFPHFRERLERLFQIHEHLGDPSRHDELTTWPAAAARDAPRQVGGYEIVRELGRGGMGVVYLARQPHLQRLVAIKVILGGAHADAQQRRRFLAEAQAVAKLQHPGIVQIYEIDEHEGNPFLALEYVAGGSLADRLTGKPVMQRRAAELVGTLAGAVHHAHQHGIIHRDLKPANVLLQNADFRVQNEEPARQGASGKSAICNLPSAIPKITDFGLAKDLEGKAGPTRFGVVVGTPSYMAPEQAAGKDQGIGPGLDVYALGAILYELLTGRPPFQGDSEIAVLEQVMYQDPISVRRLQPSVARDLETICLHCLHKEPRKRYVSAAALADDLRRFLADEPIQARPVGLWKRGVKWARRRPAIAGLIAAVVLITAAGLVGVTWAWRIAENSLVKEGLALQAESDERKRAEKNARRAQEAVDNLTNVGRDLAGQPGMRTTARELLEKSLAFYQESLAQNSSDPTIRRETAQAYMRLDQIYTSLRQVDEAEKALLEAISLYQGLVDDFPENSQYLLEKGVAQLTLGDRLRAARKNAAAVQTFRESIRVFRSLLREQADNVGRKATLVNALVNLATMIDLREERGDVLQEAMKLADEVALAVPSSRQYQLEKAQVYDDYGAFLLDCEQISEARRHCQLALKIRKMRENEKNSPEHRRYLSRTYSHMGRIQAAEGNNEEALKSHQEAVSLMAWVVEKYADFPIYRAELASRLGEQYSFLREQPKYVNEKGKLLETLLGHYERLVQDVPRDKSYSWSRGTYQIHLAMHLRDTERRSESEALFRAGLVPTEEFAREHPTDAYYINAITRRVGVLAGWYVTDGRWKDLVELYQHYVKRFPTNAALCNNQAWFLATCPDPQFRDPDAALRLARAATSIEKLNGVYQNTLGVVHYRRGEYREAVTLLAESMRLQNGGVPQDWFFLAMAHWKLGNKTEARQFYNKALTWMRYQPSNDAELVRFKVETEMLLGLWIVH